MSMVNPACFVANDIVAREKALRVLKQADTHRLFGTPVREIDAPGYHAAIAWPMDLSTVRSRMRHYASNAEFCAEVQLIFANAKEWNQPRGKISLQAQRMVRIAGVVFAQLGLRSAPSSRSSSGRSTPAGEEEEEDGDASLALADDGHREFYAALTAVLRRVRNADTFKMFERNVSSTEAVFYSKVITHAISIATIADELERRQYCCSSAGKERFIADVELMFSNALRWNKKTSRMWLEATRVRDVARAAVTRYLATLELGDGGDGGGTGDGGGGGGASMVSSSSSSGSGSGAGADGSAAPRVEKRGRAGQERSDSPAAKKGRLEAESESEDEAISRADFSEELRRKMQRLLRSINAADSRSFFARSAVEKQNAETVARYRSVLRRPLDLGRIAACFKSGRPGRLGKKNRQPGSTATIPHGGRSGGGDGAPVWSYCAAVRGETSSAAPEKMLDRADREVIILEEISQFHMDLQLIWRNAAVWNGAQSMVTEEGLRIAQFATEQLQHARLLVDPLLCALLPDRRPGSSDTIATHDAAAPRRENDAALALAAEQALALAARLEPSAEASTCTIREIFRIIWKNDTLGIFRHPVSAADVPGYADVVKKPIDLCTIARKIMSGHYSGARAKNGGRDFYDDVSRIYNNAMKFNTKESIFYKLAEEALLLVKDLIDRGGLIPTEATSRLREVAAANGVRSSATDLLACTAKHKQLSRARATGRQPRAATARKWNAAVPFSPDVATGSKMTRGKSAHSRVRAPISQLEFTKQSTKEQQLLLNKHGYRELGKAYDVKPARHALCSACGVAHHEQLPCAHTMYASANGVRRRGKGKKIERSKYKGVEWSSAEAQWRASLAIPPIVSQRRKKKKKKTTKKDLAASLNASLSASASGSGSGSANFPIVPLGLYKVETVAAGVHDIAARMQFGRDTEEVNFDDTDLGSKARLERESERMNWAQCDHCKKWRATRGDVFRFVQRCSENFTFTCTVIGRYCKENEDPDVIATADSESDDELDGELIVRDAISKLRERHDSSGGASAVDSAGVDSSATLGEAAAATAAAGPVAVAPVAPVAATVDVNTKQRLVRHKDDRWDKKLSRALDVQQLRIAGLLPDDAHRREARAQDPELESEPQPQLQRRFSVRPAVENDIHELKRLDDEMCLMLSQYAKPPVTAYGLPWFVGHCSPSRNAYSNWQTLAAVPMDDGDEHVGAASAMDVDAEPVGAHIEQMPTSPAAGMAPSSETVTSPAGVAPSSDAVGFVIFCLCSQRKGAKSDDAELSAAQAATTKRNSWIEIFWIMVDASARSQGVGVQLMRAALQRARETWPSVSEVRLHVLTQNRGAIRFYAKELDFIILERKPYNACYSAYRMTRPIDDADAALSAQLKRKAAAACIVGRHIARKAQDAAVAAAVRAFAEFEEAKRVAQEEERRRKEALRLARLAREATERKLLRAAALEQNAAKRARMIVRLERAEAARYRAAVVADAAMMAAYDAAYAAEDDSTVTYLVVGQAVFLHGSLRRIVLSNSSGDGDAGAETGAGADAETEGGVEADAGAEAGAQTEGSAVEVNLPSKTPPPKHGLVWSGQWARNERDLQQLARDECPKFCYVHAFDRDAVETQHEALQAKMANSGRRRDVHRRQGAPSVGDSTAALAEIAPVLSPLNCAGS